MKLIKLTKGQFAQVDDADFEWLNQWKWSAFKGHSTYYACRSIYGNGKQVHVRMHRIILGMIKGILVDHIDQNGLNNQRSNLRNCTNSENLKNRKPRGISKYLGVSRENNLWRAALYVNRKIKYRESFRSEEEAAKAYDEAAKKYHGEFANLNFKTVII